MKLIKFSFTLETYLSAIYLFVRTERVNRLIIYLYNQYNFLTQRKKNLTRYQHYHRFLPDRKATVPTRKKMYE